MITTPGKVIQVDSLKEILNIPQTESDQLMTLAEIVREHILKVLHKSNWKIQRPKGAAEVLGLKATTLRDRIKKRNIKRPIAE